MSVFRAPLRVIDLAVSVDDGIYINLPSSERLSSIQVQLSLGGWINVISPSVMRFLKSLEHSLPQKAILMFCGYGPEKGIGTAVIEIENIFWDLLGYPRLDFSHPKMMSKINGCPNFWGAFIVAIALANPSQKCSCVRDSDGSEFERLFLETMA